MKIAAALAGLGLVSAAATAAIGGEFLLLPIMPGFVLGSSNPNGQMREYIPQGEAIARWTRIITVQQLGYRPGLTPERFLDRWSTGFSRTCPGAVIGAVTPAPLGDHPGVSVRIDCPRNPQTGLPETVIGRTVMGDDQLHMVQAAARRTFTAADARWAASVVSGAALCAATTREPRCGAARTGAIGATS